MKAAPRGTACNGRDCEAAQGRDQGGYNRRMPTLLLMRHGKSRWDEGPVEDHERGLAPRGTRAAQRMGRFLSRAGICPDLILSSDALRTLTTARIVREAAGWKGELRIESRLYACPSATVLEFILTLPNTAKTVMLVGHNPAMTETTVLLSGGTAVRFPTAAVACFEINESWENAGAGYAELRWLLPSRLIKVES